MECRLGIIGLPNVGKSTLFNALTKIGVRVSNFPFSTIEPNIGIVSVPDTRLHKVAEIVKPQYVLPATIKFVDIAGLVKGASKGEGLGNQFLQHIRETEVIGHVVRCFEKNNTVHITGQLDPAKDINVINDELAFSDFEICDNAIHRTLKKVKCGDKNAKEELAILEKCFLQLKNIGLLRSLDLSKKEKELIGYLNFLTLKPTMYIANVNEDGIENNQYFDQVADIAKREKTIVVPICAAIEAEISKLSNKERHEFMQELGFKESNIDHIIRSSYSLLNMHTFFTIERRQVRAWTIPIGTTALQAAGKIHSDFKKGFIRAKIISYNDFVRCKGEKGAKETGRMRFEGKNYIVNDGDIINFLFKI